MLALQNGNMYPKQMIYLYITTSRHPQHERRMGYGEIARVQYKNIEKPSRDIMMAFWFYATDELASAIEAKISCAVLYAGIVG